MKDYCKIAATKGEPNEKTIVFSKEKVHVPRKTRRATNHFPDELSIKPDRPKLANPNHPLAERPREWPYLEPVLEAKDEETDTEISEPDTKPAEPLKSFISTPEEKGKVAKPMPAKTKPKPLMAMAVNEIREARKPNDSDVVKRAIDPLFAQIPSIPFSQAGRWAFEQWKAKMANSGNVSTSPETQPPAPFISTPMFPEPITDEVLAEAKHSNNWWRRNAAVVHIVKRTFSEEFNKVFKIYGEFMETQDFPDEASKFEQLLLDYRIDDD